MCEAFCSELSQCVGDETKAAQLNMQRKEHLKLIEKERRAYYRRREKAVSYPTRYFSAIIDGADQKNYGLPHFALASKSDKGHKIKGKFVVVLEHRVRKQLSLLTMTDEFATGACTCIELVCHCE